MVLIAEITSLWRAARPARACTTSIAAPVPISRRFSFRVNRRSALVMLLCRTFNCSTAPTRSQYALMTSASELMVWILSWCSAASSEFRAIRTRARLTALPRPRRSGCVSDNDSPPLHSLMK